MSDHARLSPSKRHRWRLCPGSVNKEANYEDVSSPAAIDGTHTHTVLQYCLTDLIWDAFTIEGQTLTDKHGSFVVDRDRVGRVNIALGYVKSRFDECHGNVDIISEEKVDPSALILLEELHGTVDIQIIGDEFIEVIDYKDGMEIVDVNNNPQLEQYVLGVLAKSAKVIHHKTVRMTVIQPKLAMKGLPVITSSEKHVGYFYYEVLPTLYKEARATENPDAQLVPGETQCKFCKHKGSCTALVSSSVENVGMLFDSITLHQDATDKNPADMSDEQIRKILESAPLLRQMLEGVEKEALRRFESGGSIPGFKLVRGRGSRAWSMSDDEIAQRLTKMGIPKNQVYVTSVISPAQVEKVTWEKKDGEKKQLSPRQLEMLKKDYIKQSQGKPTVVPESDHRESISVDISSMFQPVYEMPDWLK